MAISTVVEKNSALSSIDIGYEYSLVETAGFLSAVLYYYYKLSFLQTGCRRHFFFAAGGTDEIPVPSPG
ncbi:MAG: hypothetical protein RQM92_00810 [Candidatus Syntrophopropionicum ammoniitolerans]